MYQHAKASPRRRNRFENRATSLFTIVAIASTAACAAAVHPRSNSFHLDETNPARLSVHIENEHSEDVTVYVIRGTSRIRLGRVGAFETRKFALSGALVGGSGFIEMTARPLAGSALAHLERTPVNAGQSVEWRLGANLRHSTFIVR